MKRQIYKIWPKLLILFQIIYKQVIQIEFKIWKISKKATK